MCLTITTTNNWSHLVSVCCVLDIDERALLYRLIYSLEGQSSFKPDPSPNHHCSCCLLFRNPWVQPVSQPPSLASHKRGLEKGFSNPATGCTPHQIPSYKPEGHLFHYSTKFCPFDPKPHVHSLSLGKMWILISWFCPCR